MVSKLLKFFNQEISGIHQAAYLLAFFAICSQVLALFRDRLLASHFGAGNTLDIYYSAFRIPDILFVTVASVVSLSVLIPFLLEKLDTSRDDARVFLDTVFTFFFCFVCVSGTVIYFLAPSILAVLFPPFAHSASFSELVALTRILILSPIFLGFSNLLASVTQIHKRFFLYAISPVLYNVGIIIGIIFFYPVWGLQGLGWGVVTGAFFHFFIQVPYVYTQGLLPQLRFPFSWTVIRKIVTTSLPRTLTVSSNELTELFLISFASFLLPGSISIFNFSFNLQSVPFSIIGVSYSLAAFPVLTRLISSGNRDEFLSHMITTSRHIIFWSIPISVMFVVLRAHIVRTILGAGKFNWDDTRLTAAALALFVVSLIAQNLVTLFVRAYYSRGKTRKPLFINVISSVCIILLTYFLVYVYQHSIFFKDFIESLLKVSDIQGTVVLMLPLGFSIGVLLNLVVHWIDFNREFPKYSSVVLVTLFQVATASIIMGYATYLFLNISALYSLFDVDTAIGIFLQGAVSGVLGIIVGIAVLYLLGSHELKEVWTTLHKKIWKARIVGPDPRMQ